MEDLVDNIMESIMMIGRIRIRLREIVRTKGEITPIIFVIKIIDIREKEVEDKHLEEQASMENAFTKKKKGIEHLNIPSAKER